MENIKIVVDSTSYMPEEVVQEYPEIKTIPLYVRFGDEVFREGVDLRTEEFYERLKNSQDLPKTSQPSVGDFLEVYRPLLPENSIISVHISSKLSGTVDSAQQAAKISAGDITVLDSYLTGMGLGFIALEGARAIRQGFKKEDVLARMEAVREGMNVIFLVDTLEYLHKGGRIGGAQALLGTILKIKPILFLARGRIEPLERARSRVNGKRRLLEILEEIQGEHPDAQMKLALHQADCLEEAQELAEQAKNKANIQEVHFSSLGPVIGTHTGPKLLAIVCFLEKDGQVFPSWSKKFWPKEE